MTRPPIPRQDANHAAIHPDCVEGYLAFAQARFDHQMDAIDGLDSKAGTIMATALAVAGFPLALLAIRSLDQNPLPTMLKLTFVLLAALLMLTLLTTVKGLRVREWERYPGPDKVQSHRSSQKLLASLVDSLDRAYAKNTAAEGKKSDQVKRAGSLLMILIAVSLVSSVGAIWPVFA